MFLSFFLVFLVCAWFFQENERSKNETPGPDFGKAVPIKTRLLALAKTVPVVAALALVVSLIGSCAGSAGTPGAGSAGSTEISESAALTKCHYAIKRLSKDPDSAEIPYADNFGTGGEYYFAWGAGSKPLRMKNTFGAMLAVGASCTVGKISGNITSLTLDGKTIM